MTHGCANMYDSRPPQPGHEMIMTGDAHRLRIENVGGTDVGFHGYTDEGTTLVDVSYVPSLAYNLYASTDQAPTLQKATSNRIAVADPVRGLVKRREEKNRE